MPTISMMSFKPIVRPCCALALVGVGIVHFVNPEPFVRIVPAMLPAPSLLVYASGALEIVFGLALWAPRLRLYAGWGMVLLFLAVFPANINMAINHIQLDPARPLPEWAAWVRLPFQVVFIRLAYWLRG